MQPVLFDVTSIVEHPIRTGIQRVERELIKHWPGPRPLAPVVFDPAKGSMFALPERALITLGNGSGSFEQERTTLAAIRANARPLDAATLTGGIFNPELFWEAPRAEFYRLFCGGGGRAIWMVYDFLPFLTPEYFPSGVAQGCMYYLRGLRSVPGTIFISKKTRREYVKRVIRDERRAGPAIALGGDALDVPRQTFSADRDTFVVIGTIERRKRVAEIMEAFRIYWAQGGRARLSVIGRMNPDAQREQALIRALETEPRFRYLGNAGDREVREELARARATVFVSLGEGFGIPPLESLHAGIPVIVHASVPSLEMLPPGGRVELEESGPEALVPAVARIADDAEAARLWAEAAAVRVPTWADFAKAAAAYVQERLA